MPTLTSVTKHFITSQEGFTTTTAGSVASGAATVTLNSVSGYTNGDQVAFVIDPTDVTKKQVFTGTIDTSGVQVTNVVWTEGTNQTHAAGATVVDYTTATHQAAMVKGVKVSLDDDGTLKAGAVDNAAAIADGVVSTAKIADSAVTPAKRSGGFKVGTFTVNGTGSQSITGVGFQPKSVIFMPLLADSTSQGLFGLGFWDGTSSVSMNMGARITATSGNFSQEATGIIFRASDFSSGAENVKAQATGTSLDADGFTINVTVSSGSQVIAYMASA